MVIEPDFGTFGSVGRCQVLLENEISISIKLVSRRKHEVFMFSLREHDHGDVALQIPPLALPRSSSSGLRRTTSAQGQGDLRIIVRASPSSTSPRASHSSSTSHRLVFPDERAGSSDRAGPSISFRWMIGSWGRRPNIGNRLRFLSSRKCMRR